MHKVIFPQDDIYVQKVSWVSAVFVLIVVFCLFLGLPATVASKGSDGRSSGSFPTYPTFRVLATMSIHSRKQECSWCDKVAGNAGSLSNSRLALLILSTSIPIHSPQKGS